MEKLEKWRESILDIVAPSTTAPDRFRELLQEVLYVDGMDSCTLRFLSLWANENISYAGPRPKLEKKHGLFTAFQIWAANQPALHWVISSLGNHLWRPLLLEDVHLLFKCISFLWKVFHLTTLFC